MRRALKGRIRAWAARRHGRDRLPATVSRRRIYIVPTRFGLMLAALLVAMLIAGLNYNSNLSLAFAFFMVSVALVAMHHCNRNLSGLSIDANVEADAFAGGDAVFYFMLRNGSAVERRDIEIHLDAVPTRAPGEAIGSVGVGSYERLMARVPTGERGVIRWNEFEVRTRHPFGWFRAWTYISAPLVLFVAPRPLGDRRLPAAASATGKALRSETRGDEDFAGLRTYAPGVPLKHMAWKVLARGGEAAVRAYTDLGAQPEWLDWTSLDGLDTEARLSQLCRWVLDCESGYTQPYGLRMPGAEIPPGRGAAHRMRCLRALAGHARPAAAVEDLP
jgi:uncharacterized protein (DUF58 family)